MKKSNDVFVRAFIDGNLGDDLFVITLCKSFPDHEFAVVGPHKYKKNFNDLQNLRYIVSDRILLKIVEKSLNAIGFLTNNPDLKYFSFLRKFNAILGRKYQKIILISGSYFIEWTEDVNFWSYYFKLEEKFYSYHPYVIGINFGPYYTNKYIDFYRKQFCSTKRLIVRDKKTEAMFKECCAQYAPDILFQIPVHNLGNPITDYILLVVSNQNVSNKYPAYINAMSSLVEQCISQRHNIVLCGFSSGEGDRNVINRILDNVTNKSENIYIRMYGDYSEIDILSLIENADLIVAGRYHAMILGWLYNKNVIPICYSEKMNSVIEDMCASISYYDISKVKPSDSASILRTVNPGPRNIESIKNQAKTNFSLLGL